MKTSSLTESPEATSSGRHATRPVRELLKAYAQADVPEPKQRWTLSAREFAGLQEIAANPEPPTAEARAGFKRYRETMR